MTPAKISILLRGIRRALLTIVEAIEECEGLPKTSQARKYAKEHGWLH